MAIPLLTLLASLITEEWRLSLGLDPQTKKILLPGACFLATDGIAPIALPGWKFKTSQTRTKPCHHRVLTVLWQRGSPRPEGTALGWGTGGAAESPGKRTPLSVQNVSLYENGVSVCMVFCLVASLAKIHCTTHIVMIYSPLNAWYSGIYIHYYLFLLGSSLPSSFPFPLSVSVHLFISPFLSRLL